jgi:hypothetical protein
MVKEVRKTRKKTKSQTKAEESKKVLCVVEDETLVTAIERDAILDCITDGHIQLMCKKRPPEVGCWCKEGYYVGEGICLAKKFVKCGVGEDKVCRACKHDNILKQLNYVFKEVFGGKYRAEWRAKREYKKKEADTQ